MDQQPLHPAADVHAEEAAHVLLAFATAHEGLERAEAARRLAETGPNRLPERRAGGPFERLKRQFENPLILFLVAAAIISLLLGHGVDAAVIAGVVLVNTGIGFFQEGKAEEALAAIRQMIDPAAAVVRDGRRQTIPASEVVPGDIVLLEAGDRVPADLRLIDARQLTIEEAILTGESLAVRKGTDPVAAEAPLGDRTSMAFAGTFVAAGQGRGVAVATGAATQLGRISTLIGSVGETTTPLMQQMARFAKKLTLFVSLLAVVAFAFAVLVRGETYAQAFMLVVGIAVAAIPEGLPAILTVALAIGVRRMAGRRALIRRLPAVETLGSVTVICSDKTGTLTLNEMAVTTLVTAGGEKAVSGVGYGPEGEIADADEAARLLATAGLLCNDAEVRQRDGSWIVDGDPMEGALVTLARKAGLADLRAAAPRADVLPFASETRRMATLNRMPDGRPSIWLKGAPEAILALCSRAHGARELDADAWHAAAERLAGRGLRVLAFATKESEDLSDLSGATFLGLAGFIDPPRPEAITAVADCRRAGIRVAMITGDHAGTARAIARELAIAEDPQVLTGAEIDRLDDQALAMRLRDTAVFARTAPEHKLRLVEAFQQQGEVVAMTGDGVNDAPALKRADIGIAMGRKGTEAAKEASDMVLADDNFASIAAAVREGRTVWDNLMKVIGWALPVNGGESMAILFALVFGLLLPITPVQILWVNMVTASALGMSLAFEPTERGAMQRPPRDQRRSILSGRLLWRIVFVSALFTAGAFGMFKWATINGADVDRARTLVVNTIVAMEIFYLFAVRYSHGVGLTAEGMKGTKPVLIAVAIVTAAQLLFTYWPPMQQLFSSVALSVGELAAVVGVGVVVMLAIEAEKALFRLRAGRAQVPQKVA
ncbi:MAG: HAD-IC family P-type ATPase [Sphingomonadaceae bacterium]